MSQHDLNIGNQTFPATRTDINSALVALGTLSSGTTQPSTTYAHQLWMDTTNNILKLRNSNNDAWIEVVSVDQVNDIIKVTAKIEQANDGSQSSPVYTFSSDTDTGMFRSGANELAFATGGLVRLTIDANGDAVLQNGTPAFKIKDVDSTGSSVVGELQFLDSADTVAAGLVYENSTLKLEIGGSAVATFDAGGSSVTPSGSLIQFAGASAPTGWLVCDGSAVSRTTYATLYSVIGTTYGSGDGSTTFNVPDLRGRTPIGVGTGTGLSARSLGATGGAETHTLSLSEIPAHDHRSAFGEYPTPGNHDFGNNGVIGNFVTTTDARGYAVDSESQGGGGAHNNMQPFLAINFIIKT